MRSYTTSQPDSDRPTGRSTTRNYLAGLGSGYLVTLVTIAVGLWLTPFTLRFLDREQYAVFALTGDMLMWLGLVDLGITASLRTQAAQLTGRPDHEQLNRLASTAFFAQCLVVLVVLVIGGGLTAAFPHFFRVRPDLRYDATITMGLLVLGSAIMLGTQTFSALLFAHQQIHIDNAIRLLLIALRTGLTVLLLKAGWGLISLAVANVAATLITGALSVIRTYRLLTGLRIRWTYFSPEVLRGTMRLGIWFSLGAVAGIVITSLDRMVTAKVLSVEMVTTLTLTSRLYVLTNSLLDQMTNTARPALGRMLGQGRKEDALRTYRHLFALSTGSAVVAAASLWAGNGCFVARWVGSANYGGVALDIALALNLLVNTWNLPNRAVLASGYIVRPQTQCRIVEGVLNLVLSVYLAKHIGLVGVALSTGIAGVMTSCWYLPMLTARMFDRRFARFAWDDAAKIVLLLVLLLPIAYLSRIWAMRIGSYPGALAGGGMTAVCGAALLWRVAIDERQRGRINSALLELLDRGLSPRLHVSAGGEASVR